jgi:hypothetical protein
VSLRRAEEEAALATAPRQPVADATTAQSRFLVAMAARNPGATPLLWEDDRADRLRSDRSSYRGPTRLFCITVATSIVIRACTFLMSCVLWWVLGSRDRCGLSVFFQWFFSFLNFVPDPTRIRGAQGGLAMSLSLSHQPLELRVAGLLLLLASSCITCVYTTPFMPASSLAQ